MASEIEFYHLKRGTWRPGGIATAAIWACALCDGVIAAMGGPGSGQLCVRCGEDIINGNVRYVPLAGNQANVFRDGDAGDRDPPDGGGAGPPPVESPQVHRDDEA